MELLYQAYFRELKEIDEIATSIAEYLPDDDMLRSGIYELLVNAIEHGNLEIGFELKSRLLEQNTLQQEIENRLADPLYSERRASIIILQDEQEICIAIQDAGKGFAWRDYIEKTQSDTALHGRGLLIAKNSGFSEFMFNPQGNQVTCIISKLV